MAGSTSPPLLTMMSRAEGGSPTIDYVRLCSVVAAVTRQQISKRLLKVLFAVGRLLSSVGDPTKKLQDRCIDRCKNHGRSLGSGWQRMLRNKLMKFNTYKRVDDGKAGTRSEE